MQEGPNIERVFAFTRSWHDQAWRAGDLATALGAELRYDRMGRGTLGISTEDEGERLISLNERVQDDPFLEHAILLHEGGHLLTKALAHGFCRPGWRSYTSELPAWLGAGLLSVSDAQVRLHDSGRCTLADLAEENAVPFQLVAIGVCLREGKLKLHAPTDEAHMGTNMTDWLIEMQRRLRLLSRAA